MTYSKFVNAEGCAEVILHTCRERGLRVEIFEPDVQRDVRFRVTAASRKQFLSTRDEWMRRLTVSDKDGKLVGASISKRKTRSRL